MTRRCAASASSLSKVRSRSYGNGAPTRTGTDAARAPLELARQHQRAQPRVQKSGDLEQQAVLAGEVHGTTAARALRASMATARLQGGSVTQRARTSKCETSPAGNIMSAPSPSSQRNRVAHGLRIALHALPAEHLDRQQHRLELMQRAQILVGEHLEVGTQRA